MHFTEYTGTVTTTGSAGTASGDVTIEIPAHGYIEWVYLDYSASAPAGTTDTTVTHAYNTRLGNIYADTDSNTDILFHPAWKVIDVASAAVTNSHRKIPVYGGIKIAIAQCDALAAAVVVHIGVMHP